MGIADSQRIFVPYSAPGDVLEIEIAEERGGALFANIVKIIKPASCRVNPPCPVFGKCGGCQWQHISYEAQLFWKRAILIETLERIGKIESPNVLDTIPSPAQWNYRNRIQLHVDSQGRVGYYRPRSKEVVEFKECLIAEKGINEELAARREEFGKRDRGVALSLSSHEGFAQINTGQNKQLSELLCNWLKEVDHNSVLELYAGAGNFTFAIAKIAGHVTASDIDGRAMRTAEKRMESERSANVQFACMPAANAARRFGKNCDILILDPPRKGCAEEIEAISGCNAKSILYISCDPATLARDIKSLAQHNYQLVRTQPVDMFPQTFHIESLSLIARKK